MEPRERVGRVLAHREADRIPIHDSPWGHTVDRWHREGLPEGQTPESYFGYEITGQGADLSFQLPAETIEETETYRIYLDANGATSKSFKDHESTPERIDFTIKDKKTWEAYKPKLAWNDARVEWEKGLAENRAAHRKGLFVTYSAAFGYDRTQGMVGSQRLLEAMLTDPAWVKDMFDTAADLVIIAAEEMMAKGFEFDGAFLFDDMGYRNAPLFSPATYRATEFESQKRMCDFFRGKGLPIILHSCGCVRQLVPMLIEAGFTCLQPVEVKAGMDLVELKKAFGDRMAFMGGIDVRAMADPDPRRIEEEIRTKIPVAKRGGGYIYHSDHSVPSNVSFAQYCRVMELVRECGAY